MKLSSRVDGSVCAVLSSHPSPRLGATTTARRSFCAARDATTTPQRRPGLADNSFCSRSSLWLLSTFTTPRTGPQPRRNARPYSSAAAAALSPSKSSPPASNIPAPDDPNYLMTFVRGDNTGSVEEHLEYHRDPYRRGFAQPDPGQLKVSERKQDVEYPSSEDIPQTSDKTSKVMGELRGRISRKMRHNQGSLEPIYNLYQQLPEPRILRLSWHWRNRLLNIMGMVPKRDAASMLRYFALLGDVKNAGLTVRRRHWNFALAFASRYASRVTSTEMESALRLWREMERQANIKGNDVTFNILFDVASKAGNFTLADMIYHEMQTRGYDFNRYHFVSLIHYFGLKLDSDGIRTAYREMVFAGEIVDTIVLNCVISGLLRCGEESAAEETYERMKSRHPQASPPVPERNYLMNKVITQTLMMFSKIGKMHPELQRSMQESVRLAPDLHTYRLFIEHHAIRTGNLSKVAQYLDEMKLLKIEPHPTIFLALFKGFYTHGGHAKSEWSEQRLESILAAFYQAKDEAPAAFRIDKWPVVWALRAVKKCCGNEAVVHTFEAMAERWDVSPDQEPYVQSLLGPLMKGIDMRSSHGDWAGPVHRRYKKNGARL